MKSLSHGQRVKAAAFLGRVDAVGSLLEHGANPSAKDQAGQTPLDVTRTDWTITTFILELLDLDLSRAQVEEDRATVAKLLRE